jgi:dynein heavy chain
MCLQANKRWKGLEMRLTDAANEAKDNVRYLATLDQPFEVGIAPGCLQLCWL